MIFNIIAEPYIKQCSKQDPELIGCLKGALHHLRPYLAEGIEDIKVILRVKNSLFA